MSSSEREQFEKWASSCLSVERDIISLYTTLTTQCAWAAWQAARGAQASAEPCAWLFQHDETGRMTCVANDGMNTPEVFTRLNPRQLYVGPAYAAPHQEPLTDMERIKVVMLAMQGCPHTTGTTNWAHHIATAVMRASGITAAKEST